MNISSRIQRAWSVVYPPATSGGRIHGLDPARALAIIGMVASHLAPSSAQNNPLIHGFPSALFAVLAGVSMSIMASSGNAAGGIAATRAHHRLLIRGVIIFAIGLFLSSVQISIAVVLLSIAAILFFLPPVTHMRTRNVWILFFILLVVGSALTSLLTQLGSVMMLVGTPYPLNAWLCYGTAGILIHRFLVFSRKTQIITFLLTGTLSAVLYWYLSRSISDSLSSQSSGGKWSEGSSSWSTMPDSSMSFHQAFLSSWVSKEPHTGGIVDILFSLCVALAVISLCLLVCTPRMGAALCYPLRALGSMALTSYVIHVLSAGIFLSGNIDMVQAYHNRWIDSSSSAYSDPQSDSLSWSRYQEKVAAAGNWEEFTEKQNAYYAQKFSESSDSMPDVADLDSWSGFFITIAIVLIFATLWRLFFRRGPIEALVAWGEKRGLRANRAPRGNPSQNQAPALTEENPENNSITVSVIKPKQFLS
ncbi:DUF418 domain-containing protein [Corynebacterium sp. sy017]|uniref:DUF418 domain-containing protein n=1 Tax=unclassified Corynebacterium TaxID=2624378 RepID=UPI0011868E62|nr:MULTISPECIES: DUF418 domain-containing protein [unclassified Corynebacterium]MBP3088459.1 DUF418 domain-containing protein [Corynebacterium sp. sy017]TSD91768.1 DUF418 domain-containing protein [Corynebacterium sp. SY003]